MPAPRGRLLSAHRSTLHSGRSAGRVRVRRKGLHRSAVPADYGAGGEPPLPVRLRPSADGSASPALDRSQAPGGTDHRVPCAQTSGSLVLLLASSPLHFHPLGSHAPLSCMHAGFCPRLCSRVTQPEMSQQHFSNCVFRQPKVQRDHLTCSRSTQMAEPGFTRILFTA